MAQRFQMIDRGSYFESVDEIPEPHAFNAHVRAGESETRIVRFEEHEHHEHGASHRDNNMRAAVVHVMADAAVSVLVIVGLLLARAFGWLWMDPVADLIGAFVIASWSYGLIRNTGAILLDMTPDKILKADGDHVKDLHLWRLGPGHLGAILCVSTTKQRNSAFYHSKLAGFSSLSHVTIEVETA